MEFIRFLLALQIVVRHCIFSSGKQNSLDLPLCCADTSGSPIRHMWFQKSVEVVR